MRSSFDAERAAFLDRRPSTPSSPSAIPLSENPHLASSAFDDGPGPSDGLLSKPQWSSRTSRWRRLGLGFRFHRRRPWRICALALKCTLGIALCLVVFTPFLAPSYLHPPAHYRQLAARCEARSQASSMSSASSQDADLARLDGCANAHDEKIFIAVSLYDKNGHLAGGSWGDAVLELIHLLGPDNVFLSIYENDSGSGGAAALREFKERVSCRHSIVYEDHVSMNLFPNVTLPDGSVRTKRVAYLADIRNRALRPLDTLVDVDFVVFDRVLFLNDVAFRPLDAAQLLFSTNVGANGRAQYLSTCALDWKHPYLFYDVFAQRDAEGFSNGLPLFPVFSGAGQALTRSDMLAQKDAVRVTSCWGGMVAMDAAYIQNTKTELPRPDFREIGAHVIDPANPARIVAPVRFRHEPELYFDACECCLLLADVSQAARAAGAHAADLGVFVNPYVRVAYNWAVLSMIPMAQRWERLLVVPQMIFSRLSSLPTHNPHREVKEGDAFVEEVWSSATNSWQMMPRMGRNGMFCGVREMQLIQTGVRKGDKNWVKMSIPRGQTLHFPT